MIVFGERGGKRVWKVFIRSVRCGGVEGDGGGKEAKTSYMKGISKESAMQKLNTPAVE